MIRVGWWLLFLTALGCPGADDTGKDDTGGAAEVCDNEIDDDADTYADCTDPDCYTDPSCVRVEDNCTNGADDDGDKRQDCDDSDCADDPACAGIETDCENAVDDDGDGATDCDDSDCKDDPLCRETSHRRSHGQQVR